MTTTTSSIIVRLLEPLITPEVAERLVDIRADEATQARLDELGDKCNEGLLTPDERREYRAYIEGIDVVSILQAKARRLLGQPVE